MAKHRKSSNIKRVKGRVFEKRWVELIPKAIAEHKEIMHAIDNFGMAGLANRRRAREAPTRKAPAKRKTKKRK